MDLERAMHEMFMAGRIVEELGALLAPYRPCRLTAVRLRVGVLRQVVPELIRSALDALLAGTGDRGAAVAVEPVFPAGRCNGCGHAWVFADWEMKCPACGSADLVSRGGDELVIENITLERDDSGPAAAPSVDVGAAG